jgi:archaellum component FlaC
MTDDGPDNLVLRYLRRIDEKVDRLGERIDDLTVRVTAVEVGLNAVRRDLVNLFEADARLERIEQRLDLRDS